MYKHPGTGQTIHSITYTISSNDEVAQDAITRVEKNFGPQQQGQSKAGTLSDEKMVSS